MIKLELISGGRKQWLPFLRELAVGEEVSLAASDWDEVGVIRASASSYNVKEGKDDNISVSVERESRLTTIRKIAK